MTGSSPPSPSARDCSLPAYGAKVAISPDEGMRLTRGHREAQITEERHISPQLINQLGRAMLTVL
jgi:hypothetical protein